MLTISLSVGEKWLAVSLFDGVVRRLQGDHGDMSLPRSDWPTERGLPGRAPDKKILPLPSSKRIPSSRFSAGIARQLRELFRNGAQAQGCKHVAVELVVASNGFTVAKVGLGGVLHGEPKAALLGNFQGREVSRETPGPRPAV